MKKLCCVFYEDLEKEKKIGNEKYYIEIVEERGGVILHAGKKEKQLSKNDFLNQEFPTGYMRTVGDWDRKTDELFMAEKEEV
jgi:hypothetical protein